MDERSSNSSAPEPSFRRFLERSLRTLADEMPVVHGALCRALHSRRVVVCVDGEEVLLWSDGATLVLGAGADGAVVEFHADSRTLLALTAGDVSFLDAALAERVQLRGPLDDVLVFYDALVLYLGGAVRSPSLPALLAEFSRARGGSRDA